MEWRSIQSFLEPGLMAPAVELGRIWSLAQTRVAGSKLSYFKVKTADVSNWWICSVEGVGLTTIKGDLQAVLPPECALLTLALNGRYQFTPRAQLVTKANSISLSKWGSEIMDPITTWGAFHYIIFYLPVRAVEEGFADRAPPYGESVSANKGSGAVLAACLRAFARELLQGKGSHSLARLQDNIVGMTVQAFTEDDTTEGQARRSPFDDIRTYIEDYLTDPMICPKSVASACGFSERQFYRIFARRGETFGDFLRQLRLEHAAYALRQDRDSTISEIAFNCGFNSSSYFSQAFRAYYGSTPSDYRLSS